MGKVAHATLTVKFGCRQASKVSRGNLVGEKGSPLLMTPSSGRDSFIPETYCLLTAVYCLFIFKNAYRRS